MAGLRPTTIRLKSGHVLTTTPGDLIWTCTPAVPGRDERPLELRDLVERIAHAPGTDVAYGLSVKNGAFPVIYAILAEIRAAHGDAFAWQLCQPDGSSLMILDELDDYCCESRVWGHGGTLPPTVTKMVGDKPWETRDYADADGHARGRETLLALIAAHNHRIGFATNPEAETSAGVGLRAEVIEDHIVLSDPTCPVFHFKAPRELGPREHAFAEYLIALAA